MLNDPNKKAARKTLNIMINLYKKKIWNDSKTVNAIGVTCTSNDPKIAYSSCQFFLSEYEEAEHDSSDEEQLEELKNRYKLLGKTSNKKTKARKNKMKLLMKSIDRREKRRSKVEISKDFMPIDILNDPTNFAERLYAKLKNLKENFKLKLALIRLIGRVIGRHKLYINNYYSYMLSYLFPGQSELTVILAAIIESCHSMVPPADLDPIMSKLFDNFISETLPAPIVTIGLNTAREIIERSPYLIKEEYITVINTLKEYKNKSVTNAARSMINCLKEINSNVLDIYDKDREKTIYYGQSKVSDTIDGIDLLKKHENLPDDYRMEHDVLLDDLQLRKIKVLRMKYAAEKVQNKKVNLSKDDINDMVGDKREEENEEDMGEELEELDEDLEALEGEELEDEDDLELVEDSDDYDEEDEQIKSNLNQELSLHESDDGAESDDEDDGDMEDDEDIDQAKNNYELDSEELKSNSSDDDAPNVHGFVDPDQINTYRKRFNEKKDQLKNEEKEKYEHQRKKKTGGETNKEKLKNKPLMMIIPKKRKQVQEKLISMNKKIKNLKVQLGRFKRGNMTLKKKGGLSVKQKGGTKSKKKK
jgi:protein SDA1